MECKFLDVDGYCMDTNGGGSRKCADIRHHCDKDPNNVTKAESMQEVGTIVRLKKNCLGNSKGTIGVVFYDYGDGFQAIFKNGNYDGFSTDEIEQIFGGKSEADFLLEKVGFEPALAGYRFKNVLKVEQDFRDGVFDCVLKGVK